MMIRFGNLAYASEEYKIVITLERLFGHKMRSVFRALFGVILFGGLLAMGMLLLGGYLPESVLPLLDILSQEESIIIRVIAGSALCWIILRMLDAYWRSFYFRLEPTTLVGSKKKLLVSYELAEILLASNHPTQSFLERKIGREILLRAGYEENQTVLTMSPKEALLAAQLSPKNVYDISDLVSILASHDEAFMKSLFRHSISRQDLFGSTHWVMYRSKLEKQANSH